MSAQVHVIMPFDSRTYGRRVRRAKTRGQKGYGGRKKAYRVREYVVFECVCEAAVVVAGPENCTESFYVKRGCQC